MATDLRLLVFNLATDADDPVLGFTSRWVTALAKRSRSVDVISMRVGRIALPENVRVHSVGKDRGYSRARRVAVFYQHLSRVLRDRSIDVAFSHMAPVFTVLSSPVLHARRVPIVTWYAHRQLTSILRLAHRVSARMVSINAASYPYRHDKLTILGHGIDTARFHPDAAVARHPPVLLSVGRLSPIKDPITLVRATALLRANGHDVRCVLVGGAPDRDRDYGDRLREQVRDMGLDGAVDVAGPVPHDEVDRWYRACFAHVNCSPADNALDKAGLEAMACGRPSLSSALSFRETMGRLADRLTFRAADPAHLAEKLAALLVLPAAEVAAAGAELRARVVQMHDVEGVADRLMTVFGDAITQHTPR
jgi:glycosyltransferase involved in cell wall biosynthesis